MTWYLSGPMSGHSNMNVAAFEKAATVLRMQGYTIVSPAENLTEAREWREAMKTDIKRLVDCDGICLLDGWSRSRGSILELQIATGLRMAVAYFDAWTGTFRRDGDAVPTLTTGP